MISKNDYSMTYTITYSIIIQNGDCPVFSIFQKGSDAQEATNFLNQAKECHFEPIE